MTQNNIPEEEKDVYPTKVVPGERRTPDTYPDKNSEKYPWWWKVPESDQTCKYSIGCKLKEMLCDMRDGGGVGPVSMVANHACTSCKRYIAYMDTE